MVLSNSETILIRPTIFKEILLVTHLTHIEHFEITDRTSKKIVFLVLKTKIKKNIRVLGFLLLTERLL